MWKKIIEFLFGAKLPCCVKGRHRAKPGSRYVCPRCDTSFFWAKNQSGQDIPANTAVALGQAEVVTDA